jgi:hypothetical protein
MTHHVYTTGNHYLVVSDEGYQRYLDLLEDIAVCHRCQRPYTLECPRVYENTCVSCFLKKREAEDPTIYLGPIDASSPLAQYYSHQFLVQGDQLRVHLTKKDDSDWKESAYETLRHFQFPLPPVEYKGQHLGAFDWRIYGDVATSLFLFVARWGSVPSVVFLTCKGGSQAREFSMRTKQDRRMYHQAKAHLEAITAKSSKNPDPVESSDVYRYLSAFLSAKFPSAPMPAGAATAAAEPESLEVL